MTANLFVPPAAEGLPPGALDSATEGADRLDATALTPTGRNFLAHALVQLARDGWLRPEPGEGFEAVRERPTVEPQSSAVVSSPPAAWLDGHPQLEAIASAVYERCETGDGGIVHDDPRTIAVAALKGLLAPGDRDDEAQQQCPGYETVPNRCACPCEGCMHHCGAHLPAVGARQPDTETLPPPEGPEYTPCACGHIEPEHRRQRPGWTREACLKCACVDYSPVVAQPDRDAQTDAPSEEQIVRDHVTTVHLIGEQLAGIESWLWERLAEVRGTAAPSAGGSGAADETRGETGEGGDRLVAHVLATDTDLHCLRCAPPPYGDIWTPVIADELEDGGVCVRCGVDVLIPQEADRD